MPAAVDRMNMEAQLEEVDCPLCHSGSHSRAYGFPPFAVTRCRDCDFYYLSPRLVESQMLRAYGDAYFEGEGQGYVDYSVQEQSLRKTFRRLLKEMRKRGLAGGRLLEIGCGYGYFLDEARDHFKLRVGTDYSRRALEEARSRADRVYEGGVEALPEDERFDCIVATQVIEHIYEPLSFLEKLRGRLFDGGSLVMAAPDMGSFWRRLMGRRWPSFKIPEHVQYFDRSSLSTLMQQAGLREVQALPYPHAFTLSLFAQKMKLPAPPFLSRASLWVPATTVAMYGINRTEGREKRAR
jgi:2-polyprenyl-3-methyl-5-hydroxy-6-metoxy-1,4-benzoquinol methylase